MTALSSQKNISKFIFETFCPKFLGIRSRYCGNREEEELGFNILLSLAGSKNQKNLFSVLLKIFFQIGRIIYPSDRFRLFRREFNFLMGHCWTLYLDFSSFLDKSENLVFSVPLNNSIFSCFAKSSWTGEQEKSDSSPTISVREKIAGDQFWTLALRGVRSKCFDICTRWIVPEFKSCCFKYQDSESLLLQYLSAQTQLALNRPHYIVLKG